MHSIISDFLKSIDLGKPQTHKNLHVVPLFTALNGSPVYISLDEAMTDDLITIKEVSHGGSVPQLTVINRGELPVLLLDGEELAGAKQNRVVNTTILLKEKSETVIPVSCTEQGRWSYISNSFKTSGYVAFPSVRQRKVRSVSESLKDTGVFMSDQAEVWHTIAFLDQCAGVESDTGAMKDIYEFRGKDINGYLKNIKPVPEQKGLCVFLNNTLVGIDFISQESVFEKLHSKLIKSYALEALLQPVKKVSIDYLEHTREFIAKLLFCKEKKYPSVGYGIDYRYQDKNAVGSALVYDDKVIHLAFFPIAKSSDEVGEMSSSRRRRGFRIYEDVIE